MVQGVKNNVSERLSSIARMECMEISGRVSGVSGLIVEVREFSVPVGAQCHILTRQDDVVLAEVIGFREDLSLLIPLSAGTGIAGGDLVLCKQVRATIPVSENLLGRVINGFGEPIDGKGPLLCQLRQSIDPERLEPLQRERIKEPIGTGIRSIDALMTCGRGQRMGIFSGPGVGKSVLLGTIARYTTADISIIALVGERGREVREFIEKDLGPEGLSRSVVVVSTSEEPPPLRVRASHMAATLAEYFRRMGRDVLLLMDSITRVAMAQRQIGLALGEPPATKGYTPSVFALLPALVERCGISSHGSITGFYTVLVEGDDVSEPISDAMRGLLDGHLWLSRDLANRNHYPAIDTVESVSRVMTDVVDEQHLQNSQDITRLIAIYRDIEDLVNIGAYAAGNNPEHDLAVQSNTVICDFLRQGMHEGIGYSQAVSQLQELVSQIKLEAQQNAVAVTEGNTGDNLQTSSNDPRPLGLERMMAGV